jgi:alpha-1,6-mannosyltransferase
MVVLASVTDQRLMTVCDFSPFYCENGGGIRTFHRARIEWFRRNPQHRYLLISPGPGLARTALAPNVGWTQVYGVPVGRGESRYRLLLDYPAVRAAIAQCRPDVVEVHDPWISAPFALWLRRQGAFHGLLTSFCHSDPVMTYVAPRLTRMIGRGQISQRLIERADLAFRRLQAHFDIAFTSSDTMQARLSRGGVSSAIKLAFGVEPALLAARRSKRSPQRLRRILYAGRLDDDKEFDLVLDVLPDLLRRPNVYVTIMGTGARRTRVMALSHPRLRYLGFVADPRAVGAVYAANDVLLAPGRFETFGLSALEAIASGLVVVGPDEGGTGEILRQLNSPLVFVAGDRQSFMARIDAAIEGNMDDLSARGRTIAAAYGTWHDAIGRQVAIYQARLDGGAESEAPGVPARRDARPCAPARTGGAIPGVCVDSPRHVSARSELSWSRRSG